MTTANDTLSSVNDSALEVITGIQERIVAAQKDLAAAIAELLPETPDYVRLPEMPEGTDPKSIVEQTFDFQARLLEANKTFSLGVLDAWSQTKPPATKSRAAKK